MTPFTSTLGPHLARFLKHKRDLGYAYGSDVEWLLHRLDRFATESGLTEPIVGENFVRRFVSTGADGSRSHRLWVVRQFCRFIVAELPHTFVPKRCFLGVRRRQPAIRVLSREEARRFLDTCESLADTASQRRHCRLIHGTALWMLLMTGLRRGEALGLGNEDVDLEANVLTIRKGKFGKSRFVPLAAAVAERLRHYRDRRNARLPVRLTAAFFPSSDGLRPCNSRNLYSSFRRVLRRTGIPHAGRGHGPRLHDLRHSFACLRLLAWYEDGADLNARLPLLATYLGHVGLKSTQVYLHMTRDLVGEVVQRQQHRFGDLITAEVPT